jgi:fructose-specific component phosphotransferase system IIB-like protein
MLPDELAFAQIPTRTVWVADLRQQYAEKLHAITRQYHSGDSSRVRDLIDLVLLVEDGVPADTDLVNRVLHVFAIRRTHTVPDALPSPPPAWADPYAALAAEIGLPITSPAEAHTSSASTGSRHSPHKEDERSCPPAWSPFPSSRR